MSTIPAIETHYAGYRFRSRLEARWAVFFHTLGIDFRYESEGYLIGPGRNRPYLPDFWLPALGVWVEVKGDMTDLDVRLMDDAVNPSCGLPRADPYGDLSILILGPIPDPGMANLHWLLYRSIDATAEHFCACHELHYAQVTFRSFPPAALAEARHEPGCEKAESPGALLHQVGRSLLRPLYEDIVTPRPSSILIPDVLVSKALRAARSARFEHGESGAA